MYVCGKKPFIKSVSGKMPLMLTILLLEVEEHLTPHEVVKRSKDQKIKQQFLSLFYSADKYILTPFKKYFIYYFIEQTLGGCFGYFLNMSICQKNLSVVCFLWNSYQLTTRTSNVGLFAGSSTNCSSLL